MTIVHDVYRNKGYIVQTFVVAQTPAPACHILQHISGRRVVSLEPWLHAGSTLENVFWSSAEGADAAVIVVRSIPCPRNARNVHQ